MVYFITKCRKLEVIRDYELLDKNISNPEDRMRKLSKHEHFANLTSCAQSLIEDIKNGTYLRKIYDINREDLSHLIPHEGDSVLSEEQSDFLHQVSIDPDDILPQHWKQRFFDVCKQFTAVITLSRGNTMATTGG